MSHQHKDLTELQECIIDVLANDYESLEQISEMVGPSITLSQVKATLWTLIQETYVACYAPTKTEMESVIYPEHQKLGTYWFTLTKKGEQLLSDFEYKE